MRESTSNLNERNEDKVVRTYAFTYNADLIAETTETQLDYEQAREAGWLMVEGTEASGFKEIAIVRWHNYAAVARILVEDGMDVQAVGLMLMNMRPE